MYRDAIHFGFSIERMGYSRPASAYSMFFQSHTGEPYVIHP